LCYLKGGKSAQKEKNMDKTELSEEKRKGLWKVIK
jgi:hypothetical protein